MAEYLKRKLFIVDRSVHPSSLVASDFKQVSESVHKIIETPSNAPKIIFKIPSEVSITGVTGPVVVFTAPILVNTLSPFVNLRLQAILDRSGGSGSTSRHYMYLSQSSTFDITTSVQIGQTAGSTQVYFNIDRDFDIINNELIGYPFNTDSYTSRGVIATTRSTTPFNRSVNNYIHFVTVLGSAESTLRVSRGHLIQI